MIPKVKIFGGCVVSIIALGAAAVCVSLMFPLFFAEESRSKGILFDFVKWSTSSNVIDNSLQSPDVMVDGGLDSVCEQQLKVYVYEFPRRFNFGILKHTQVDLDLPWPDDEVPPPWAHRSRVEKSHSVEYWLLVDLLEGRRGDKQFIRVRDPKQADLFFVPFFSSLCYDTYGGKRTGLVSEDKAIQEEVVKLVVESPYWKHSGGEDHIIPLHHPNAFSFSRHLLNASIFIVADFGRTVPQVSSLKKDVVAPYYHVVPTYEDDNPDDPFNSRETLLFFQGTIKRKDNGIVRSKLADIIRNETGVHFEDGIKNETGYHQAAEGMRNSKFCLDPAGDTPASCRLFDAIVSHCVPVVLSDKIELPFEADLDYTSFALFYSVEESLEPGWLVSQLRNVSQVQWLQMWNRLKGVSHHFEYQFPSKKNDAVSMIWQQIHRKVPDIKLRIHRKERLKIADWWNW
ncbi:hypothetical protein R1sor_004564 [Riccia sorocarpa]|uniref:Exostosin GT47 domain-containing protein n=1 Tax=Riccia sorocarpa TaxID=122646 RepID=A0ABD3HHN4_9MARC